MLLARDLLEIDQIEGRALKARTACNTINELCEMMLDVEKKEGPEKFEAILRAALVTKNRTETILENLRIIIAFEAKLHFESYSTFFDLELNNLSKDTKKPQSEIESNSQELAMSYLPYWDTKITESKEEDTKKAREWFELTPNEAHNLCKRINCLTFRDFIKYYRTNQRLYSPMEIKELNKKGIDEVRINKFTKLITFLSAQWLAFPLEISSFLSLSSHKIKLDLSQIRLQKFETLQALISSYLNCNNYFRRLDISGCKLVMDISHVINLLIVKLDTERIAKEKEDEEKPDEEKEKLDKFYIEELCISGNGFSQKGMDQLMKYGQRIRSFSFDKTGLDKKVFEKFDRFLMVIKNLRVLSLEFNNVGNNGIKIVLDNLRISPSLIYLNITENLLTNDFVGTLTTFLTENKHIECLECERNM